MENYAPELVVPARRAFLTGTSKVALSAAAVMLLAGKDGAAPSINEEAVRAMVSLGYERRPAEEAVRRAVRELGGRAAVEDVIRRSLSHV